MSLSTKLKELKDVHFTELTKKQADGVVVVLGKTSEEAAIKELCEGLDTVQLDTLMRVIYKGLESGKSSSVLFRWHAVVCCPAPFHFTHKKKRTKLQSKSPCKKTRTRAQYQSLHKKKPHSGRPPSKKYIV